MIKATGNISHDGVDYVAGEILEGTENQEQALIDFGVAEPIDAVAPVEEAPVVEEPVAEEAVAEPVAEEAPEESAVPAEEIGTPELELAKMSRAELEAKALALGIAQPEDFDNKPALIEAIETVLVPAVEADAAEEATE